MHIELFEQFTMFLSGIIWQGLRYCHLISHNGITKELCDQWYQKRIVRSLNNGPPPIFEDGRERVMFGFFVVAYLRTFAMLEIICFASVLCYVSQNAEK